MLFPELFHFLFPQPKEPFSLALNAYHASQQKL